MEGEIRDTTAALVGSLQRGNAATAAGVYAEDATLLAPTAELIRGRAEIEAYWQAGIALGLSSVEFERQVLESVGAEVVEVGRYAVSVDVDRSERVVDRGTYLVLHTQIADGSWHRTVDVFKPDEPSPARRDELKEEQK